MGSLCLIDLSQPSRDVFVIIGQSLECLLSDPLLKLPNMGKPDNGIPAFDMVIEKIERLTGVVGLKPEGDFAEFYGQRIFIYAVYAVTYDIPYSSPKGIRRRLVFAGADFCQFHGDPSGGIQKDMATSAGHVTDLDGKEILFFVSFFQLLFYDVV